MPIYSQQLNGGQGSEAQRIQRFIADGGTAAIDRGRFTLIALAIASADTTLPTPTIADDGKIVICWSEFAHAHVVTTPLGFNGKGAAGTATFVAALGNSFAAIARAGSWWNLSLTGVAIA